MKKNNKFTGIVFLLFAAIACNMSVAKNKAINVLEPAGDRFAVLELFTSEGCSSCPAADAVLAKLSKEYKEKVLALEFHVDYWNRLGWTDSFSNAAFSRRQEKYAVLFHLNSIYTPQVIINGRHEMVGSDETNIRSNILQELKDTATQIITLQSKMLNEKSIGVSYNVDKTSNALLNIALIQLHGETAVKRGENGGHILQHTNIVRDFKTVHVNEQSQGSISLDVPKGLSAKDCKVIAYLQDANDLHVKAVTESLLQ